MLESGAADVAETCREITSLVNVMVAITGDFLDVQALSAGMLKLSPVWTSMRELLER